MLINTIEGNIIVESKVTGRRYKVYKIHIEQNKIKNYEIYNESNMEWWDARRFYELSAITCCGNPIIIKNESWENEIPRKINTALIQMDDLIKSLEESIIHNEKIIKMNKEYDCQTLEIDCRKNIEFLISKIDTIKLCKKILKNNGIDMERLRKVR